MSRELCDLAHSAMVSRSAWEAKQRLYYQMRHDGIRRRNKPFPAAADLHFPLVDMQMRKWKPFWLAQALSADRLAAFTSLQQDQLGPTAEAAADFFDFEVKQRTKFEDKLETTVDTMLLRGRGILKATVDPFHNYKLVFESIDPMFILIPDSANDFEDADFFVHVRYMTPAQYKRDRRLNQDVISSITGSKEREESLYWNDKQMREGITHSTNSQCIILWEHYTKTQGGWTVDTYSPQSPDALIRKPFGMPYKVNGEPSLPFYSFTFEVKDEGWFSPRGVAELAAPFEAYACKLWNEKADAMTFGNRPVFTSDTEIPNTANIRWNPGEFIPGNVKPIVMPQPAMSFDQEMMFTRSTSEQHQMMPDFGISQDGGQGGNKPRTATEANRISQLMSVGSDHNGRTFRRALARLYRHVWGLMVQFRRKDLTYFIAGNLQTLPEQALHDQYLITPDGSPDQWDRQQRFQKAVARFQLLGQDPNVDRDVLVREVLSSDDPRLALKAFLPGNTKAASEAEDEAMEIEILKDGFPAVVKPGEDHITRIHVLVGWLMKQQATNAPVDPVAKQRIQEHLATHFQILQKLQPQAARQLLQQVQQQEQQLMQQMHQPQPMAQQPGPPTQQMVPQPQPQPALS